jgi:hypothetical protein
VKIILSHSISIHVSFWCLAFGSRFPSCCPPEFKAMRYIHWARGIVSIHVNSFQGHSWILQAQCTQGGSWNSEQMSEWLWLRPWSEKMHFSSPVVLSPYWHCHPIDTVTLLTWALLRTTLWVSSKTCSTVYRSMKMNWFVKIYENSTIVSRSELRNGGSWKGREKTTIESQCRLRINIEITWEELIFIHTEKYILHIMYVLYVR